MKKNYIAPEMVIVSVSACCGTPEVMAASVSDGGLVKKRSSDVDDEDYESGDYEDLW